MRAGNYTYPPMLGERFLRGCRILGKTLVRRRPRPHALAPDRRQDPDQHRWCSDVDRQHRADRRLGRMRVAADLEEPDAALAPIAGQPLRQRTSSPLDYTLAQLDVGLGVRVSRGQSPAGKNPATGSGRCDRPLDLVRCIVGPASCTRHRPPILGRLRPEVRE